MSANIYIGENGSVVCYKHAGSTLQSAINNAFPNASKFLGMNNEVFEIVTDSFRDYLLALHRAYGNGDVTEIKCEVCK